MRAILFVVAILIAGCATEKLAQMPPVGVDLSGKWRLNVADSDDPMRLGQAMASGPGAMGDSGGQRGGRRGRGGGQPGSGQAGANADPTLGQGVPLPVSAVSEVLNWPGRDLQIKQLSGVEAFTSNGDNRVYQPGASAKKKTGHGSRQVCGWSGSSFVIMVEPDDDRPMFEEHYQISSDGQRLVQLVLIKSGRMTGFSMSRVWDRAQSP